jgi:glycosyltransferase involved in cell wall biosynthesis
MRLLIVSGAFPPMASGEAANTYHLARRLAEAGVDVHVLTTYHEQIQRVNGVTIHPMMKSWSWSAVPKLSRFLLKWRPDSILLMYLGGIYNYHPMVTFLPTLAKTLLPGVKFVTRFENPLSSTKLTSIVGRVNRRLAAQLVGSSTCDYSYGTLLRDSDQVTVLCTYHLSLLQEHDETIATKTEIIPPPSNLHMVSDPDGTLRSKGRQRISAQEHDFVLGYLGYIYRNKGVDTLLKAFAHLLAQNRSVRLVVIGGRVDAPGMERGPVSYFEEMQQLAVDLGVSDRVTWTGAFSPVDEAASMYIHSVDVFVLPFDNGIHLNNSSLASVVSYGIPVITTRKDHTDDAFLHGHNIWLCPPRDPIAISSAIEMLMDEPDLCRILHAGALEMAMNWFSWEGAIRKTSQQLCIRPLTPNVV